MFTKKLTDSFTQDLLNAVSGVLGEAKKCAKGCECEACEKEKNEKVEESTAAYGKAIDSEKKKNISKKDTATIGKLAAMLKKEREGKEKKEPLGVKTEEVQVDEVAPPGAKYERMVKHIKKGYAKDGKLTDKEKSIAYATAWKAKNEAIDPGLEDELMSQRQGASGKKWRVERMGKTISTHNSKDMADVKAMRHPLNKVRANEEATIDDAFQQIDELSLKTLDNYRTKARKEIIDAGANDDNRLYNKRVKGYRAASKAAGKKFAKEEAEQIDEISGSTLTSYSNKVANYGPMKDARTREKHEKGLYTAYKKMKAKDVKVPARMEEVELEEGENLTGLPKSTAEKNKQYIEITHLLGHKRRVPVHPTNAYKALNRYRKDPSTKSARIVSEDAEQIDESMGNIYIKKGEASHQTDTTIWPDSDRPQKLQTLYHRTEGEVKNHIKSLKNKYGAKNVDIKVTKLKEEAEQIDELSKEALGSYISNAAQDLPKIAGNRQREINKNGITDKVGKLGRKMYNRQKGIDTAVTRLTKEEQDFIDALNADTLDEARGRPRKAGAKDFTIHPKTKEKLMHNNPEHMARIEKLQKNGVLPKPKTEANQHIIQQLQRAKTSMRGGETIHFTHGDSTHVAGHHAAKLLDKYAGMKPDEKEAFQKKIGHSHAKLQSEL